MEFNSQRMEISLFLNNNMATTCMFMPSPYWMAKWYVVESAFSSAHVVLLSSQFCDTFVVHCMCIMTFTCACF